MTKREKRLQKAKNNPKTVDFETLDTLLTNAGFERRQPKSGSSHFVYAKGKIRISIPYKRPFIKPVYVKRVLEIIGGNYET